MLPFVFRVCLGDRVLLCVTNFILADKNTPINPRDVCCLGYGPHYLRSPPYEHAAAANGWAASDISFVDILSAGARLKIDILAAMIAFGGVLRESRDGCLPSQFRQLISKPLRELAPEEPLNSLGQMHAIPFGDIHKYNNEIRPYSGTTSISQEVGSLVAATRDAHTSSVNFAANSMPPA